MTQTPTLFIDRIKFNNNKIPLLPTCLHPPSVVSALSLYIVKTMTMLFFELPPPQRPIIVCICFQKNAVYPLISQAPPPPKR